jgi:glycosyltransferase involved in cell wall biosynthesis
VAERDGGDRIRLIHYLEHERMPALYQCADALVFPSLHEGFGIPILEAQRLGVPVVCSNAASMPEVAGDGALYFDPRSHAEFSARLTELVGNDGLRKRLVQRGGANVTRFDWRESALRTLEVYRRFI